MLNTTLTPKNYIVYGTLRILIALLWISFAIVGLHHLYYNQQDQKTRIQATVVDNQQRTLGEGTDSPKSVYTPVLRYVVDGRTFETAKGVQARSQPYERGSHVEVQYEPANPQDIFQYSESRDDSVQMLLSAFIVPGIIILVHTVRQIIIIRRQN